MPGTLANPVGLDPWQNIVNVHWGGGCWLLIRANWQDTWGTGTQFIPFEGCDPINTEIPCLSHVGPIPATTGQVATATSNPVVEMFSEGKRLEYFNDTSTQNDATYTQCTFLVLPATEPPCNYDGCQFIAPFFDDDDPGHVNPHYCRDPIIPSGFVDHSSYSRTWLYNVGNLKKVGNDWEPRTFRISCGNTGSGTGNDPGVPNIPLNEFFVNLDILLYGPGGIVYPQDHYTPLRKKVNGLPDPNGYTPDVLWYANVTRGWNAFTEEGFKSWPNVVGISPQGHAAIMSEDLTLKWERRSFMASKPEEKMDMMWITSPSQETVTDRFDEEETMGWYKCSGYQAKELADDLGDNVDHRKFTTWEDPVAYASPPPLQPDDQIEE